MTDALSEDVRIGEEFGRCKGRKPCLRNQSKPRVADDSIVPDMDKSTPRCSAKVANWSISREVLLAGRWRGLYGGQGLSLAIDH